MKRFLVVMAVLALGWTMPYFGLGQADKKEGVTLAPLASDWNEANEESQAENKREHVPFAADREPAAAENFKPVDFNGKRAMGYLEAICKIGPRMSGTAGMKQQQDLIQKHFEDLGAEVVFKPFTAKQVSRRQPVEMANIVVSWHAERKRRVILCSHYDTRPIADQEPDPRKWREKFVSANDGGSGVAFLMELGRHMKTLRTQVGVDFVFFDGEEYIFDPRSGRDRYFFGSEQFARDWRASKSRPDYIAAILLDMIAGPHARFPHEGHSWFRGRPLAQEIWGLARELGCTAFQNRIGDRVLDDHIALQRAGIPAIDIIDFSYPHWHRLSDTPDNCSPEGMEQVARVLSVWLQRVK